MKLLLPALVLALASATAVAECPGTPAAEAFFNRLAGAWNGRASVTPVGPRPYDIHFEQRDSTWIYGSADPGAAIHHWGFYCHGGRLQLRFLSTFRGNRSPTLLDAVEITGERVVFQAREPEFLRVVVTPGWKQSRFEVLHHGKPHVLIELTRRADE
ncbi:MAG TPA: hypothetical protein VK971_10090 [Thiohalobacter sp.]|nr:hypothetical protein [Thiohalobacter sp.]